MLLPAAGVDRADRRTPTSPTMPGQDSGKKTRMRKWEVKEEQKRMKEGGEEPVAGGPWGRALAGAGRNPPNFLL